MEDIFSKGLKLDVSKHVEKKGKFNYLSWAWAVQELRKLDPKATWEIITYDGRPYMIGSFVHVVVTLGDGTSFPQIHPVLDHYNKPIQAPNSFQINTSIQRCLTKAIALASGIGLYLYAGEDLPPSESENKTQKKDDFLEYMEKAREMVGDEDYFKALNDFKYNKAEEVKDIDKDVILEELRSIVRHNQDKDVWNDSKGDQGK